MTNTQQTVTLELTVEEVNIVLAGLGELPAKASIAVIDKIRRTATEQLQTQPVLGATEEQAVQ